MSKLSRKDELQMHWEFAGWYGVVDYGLHLVPWLPIPGKVREKVCDKYDERVQGTERL